MSQQGERPTGHEDDWWRQLYDDASGDTGPSVAADSLDDRFASAANTVRAPAPEPPRPPGGPTETTSPGEAPAGASGGHPGVPGGPSVPGASGRPGAPSGRDETGPWGAPDAPAPMRSAGASNGSDGSGTLGGPSDRVPPQGSPGAYSDRVSPQSPPGDPAGRDGRGHQGDQGSRRAAPPAPAPPAVPPRPWSSPDPVPPVDVCSRGPSGAGVGSAPPGVPPRPLSRPDVGAPVDADPRGSSRAGGGASGERSPFGVVPRQPGGSSASPPARDPRLSGLTPQPAPWEPPGVQPSGPVTFPPGPTPPGFRTAAPWRRTPARSPHRAQPPIPAQPPSPAPGPASEPSDARLDLPTPQADEVSLVDESGRTRVEYVGSGPPTYDAEPTALPPADPEDLGDLVADTVLDGARYGACTLRAASLRGDSARYRGEPRRDALLTARFGLGEQALVLVAMATGARATPGAHRAAGEACRWIGRAVGLSHVRLVEDIRAARRGDLKSGLHRLTDRSLGKLRASAVEQGLDPEEYTASLRCLLLPADPGCRTRVFFGVGAGGLFRLRGGEWQDIEPRVADTAGAPVVGFGSLPHETPDGDRLTMDLGITTPPSPYEPASAPPREPFRFRASVAREDDVLLLCTGGLAEPLRGEPPLAAHLAARWGAAEPPGLAAFLADAQVRVKGYADDRTAAAVWEA
ncbi:protein phosphatase 2C domain-containing protein [Streptomyces deccanensis]|uniref:protein phosphatase 2C domain-containing protein n=1 Tax=Streptomyces deccanensis TaxID=424188 RepID=UPI001EFB4FFF|nr:protein phosphatase 2C domain-containing protein [Streptomyces deccanensis]ULR54279.1 protein phosphatase 2C domain-containing protein [Streptomyces deccanensis]